jgi:hypothetical protein
MRQKTNQQIKPYFDGNGLGFFGLLLGRSKFTYVVRWCVFSDTPLKTNIIDY